MKRTCPKRSTKPILRRRATPRRGPLRDPGYRAFIAAEGFCAGCWPTHTPKMGTMLRPCTADCDAAHTENNGTSSKGPDSSCAPLCRPHHAAYDAGRADFERKYRLVMADIAAAWYKLYSETKV